MKKLSKVADNDEGIYYEMECNGSVKQFFIKFDKRCYDQISISPNYEQGSSYDKVIERLEESYTVTHIGNKEEPVKVTDTGLSVTPPNKRRDNAETDVWEESSFKLLISKNFVIKNKKAFLNLLAKLISEKLISYIGGKLSYYHAEKYVFINLNIAFKSGAEPYVMPKIYHNFDNINCLFKHKTSDCVFLFCETVSGKYPIDINRDECWHYTFDFVDKDGKSYWAYGAYIYINRKGNVKIIDSTEKLTMLSRELYAKTLGEGVKMLKRETGNLGFEMKFAKKEKIK